MMESKNMNELYHLNERYKVLGHESFWVEIMTLANEYKAINLAHFDYSFPDYISNPYIIEKFRETSMDNSNSLYQYTRPLGHLRLVNVLAKVYSKYFGREIDPFNDVLITVGADSSLLNATQVLIEKDDEVLIIEPFYDAYPIMTVASQAKCVFVPLKPKTNAPKNTVTSTADWSWDDAELEAAFNSKTKVIIINTPNNPLGKVYTQQELERIAELCIKWNVICISDEVYEHAVFDRKHLRIATLPGMWERTITIGSAGKSFGSTGVKIGWTIGCAKLVQLCAALHCVSPFCVPTFIQEVIARCFEIELARLDSPDCYFNSVPNELKPKRDLLADLLLQAGLNPVIPEGGFFIVADISSLAHGFSSDDKEAKDMKFVKHLIKEKCLATIPISPFYAKQNQFIGENYIRLCFFKNDDTLKQAAQILKNFNQTG